MPSTTTYYSLAIYNSSTDQSENFLDYRTAIAGVSAASNMSLIDDAMNDNAVAITALEARKNIIAVAATFDSPNTYLATVAAIVAYDTDQVIALKLDTDSAGTVTLNINSLGAKNVMKVNSAGTYVNLDGSDMRAEREYNCKYDGTRYVWMDATAADQINIEGTSGNIVMINSDNELEDSTEAPADYMDKATFDPTSVGGDVFDSPKGYMINGKIVLSISSDFLVLDIKTLAGIDPSASDPVRIRIGDVQHTLTSATGITLSDATNWFNSGSSELATLEVGYFLYFGYNATDGVTVGISRLSSKTKYGDFSVTSTDEDFCAINDISNAVSSDVYENVGYFHAILSAGAGYLWTLPSTAVIIQNPIAESKRLTWTPTVTGYSAAPAGGLYNYIVSDGRASISMLEPASGTGDQVYRRYTAPFTPLEDSFSLTVLPIDNSITLDASLARCLDTGNLLEFAVGFGLNSWTASGSSRIRGCEIVLQI